MRFDSLSSSERWRWTHLSYYNEIRPTIISIDPLKCPFCHRHTVVCRLLREHGSHPGARVIRFQRPDGRVGPIWVSEESSGEYPRSGSDPGMCGGGVCSSQSRATRAIDGTHRQQEDGLYDVQRLWKYDRISDVLQSDCLVRRSGSIFPEPSG